MIYRVVRDFEHIDPKGDPITLHKGSLAQIDHRKDADRLLAQGFVTHKDFSGSDPYGVIQGKPTPQYSVAKRIGIWLFTSHHYSGGRIHMYQYAWCLADAGCEVYLITNCRPLWEGDYPKNNRLHLVVKNSGKIPSDLDLIITDSKTEYGSMALQYKLGHPHIPFVCMNFETPNWVAKYDEEYSRKLNVTPDIFKKADLLLANSNLSAKYLLEWLGTEQPCCVLPPAVNTLAPQIPYRGLKIGDRPYAVWSARSPKYKGGYVAVDAIWALDVPMDLVVFGQLTAQPRDTNLHRIIRMQDHTDGEKFDLMKKAHVVLAPSKFEGYGMVPGEALSVGTPCIVYDLPVLREEYGEPSGLVYVPWGDEKAYKETVKKIAAKPKIRINAKNTQALRNTHGLSAMSERLEKTPYHSFQTNRITVQLVTYWGFVPESLESVYDYADEIFVAFGRVPHAQKIEDGSLQRLLSFPDPDNKIKIKGKALWDGGKEEMRTWCARQATGNFMILLDGDEIWTGLGSWIEDRIPFGCPRWLNFWHSENHWIYDTPKLAGTRWGRKLDPHGSVCPHYRWSWWRPSYYFHRHPRPVDSAKNGLHVRDGMAASLHPETIIYHLGHALPLEIMEAKHEFYLDRDGRDAGRIKRKAAWKNWNDKVGDCGDGIIGRVDWDLPQIVQRGFESVHQIKIQEEIEA